MENKSPTIWLEQERDLEKNLLIGGFCKEWTTNGDNTLKSKLDDIIRTSLDIVTHFNIYANPAKLSLLVTG